MYPILAARQPNMKKQNWSSCCKKRVHSAIKNHFSSYNDEIWNFFSINILELNAIYNIYRSSLRLKFNFSRKINKTDEIQLFEIYAFITNIFENLILCCNHILCFQSVD